MDENLSVEQRIARFLEANDITIIPVNGGDGIEILEFVQHMTGGTTRELGGIFYNRRRNDTQPMFLVRAVPSTPRMLLKLEE